MIHFGPILRKYKPSEEHNTALKQTASEVMGRINSILEQKKIKAKSLLVGSVAKGTNLASGDIDLFVIFSKDYSSRDMERLGLMIGHEVLPEGREKYAEHPYVSGQLGDRKVDIEARLRETKKIASDIPAKRNAMTGRRSALPRSMKNLTGSLTTRAMSIPIE